MSFKLAYIYFNNTLILQCSNAPLFRCTDATCTISSFLSAGDITTAATASAHVRVIQYLPHRPHPATTSSNIKMPNSRIYSQLTAMAANANAAAMSPLQAAQHLGSINTWPSSIIFSLFAETPSPRVTEYLTDFFSGNALPKILA